MNRSVAVTFRRCSQPTRHFDHQMFVIRALRSLPNVSFAFADGAAGVLARLCANGTRGARRLWRTLATMRQQVSGREIDQAVMFVFDEIDRPITMALDPMDFRTVEYPRALESCDLYLKTNYWPSLEYPARVHPLMNGNGLLAQEDVERLRRLRDVRRTKDVVYWAKVWEPTPGSRYSVAECRRIVEHQIRLFESIAALDARVDLMALLPKVLSSTRVDECVRRLERSGVSCRSTWGNVTSERLWTTLAGSEVVFLRPGNHLCISWRMTDLLAMGACIVYDGSPYPNWHQPLLPGVQFEDGRCAMTPQHDLPPDTAYADLRARIESLLNDPPRMQRLRSGAREYFDSYCTHEQVGSHILGLVDRTITASRAR